MALRNRPGEQPAHIGREPGEVAIRLAAQLRLRRTGRHGEVDRLGVAGHIKASVMTQTHAHDRVILAASAQQGAEDQA